jgi:hypothetical protein
VGLKELIRSNILTELIIMLVLFRKKLENKTMSLIKQKVVPAGFFIRTWFCGFQQMCAQRIVINFIELTGERQCKGFI